jgi:hypothetical protein
MTFLRAIPCPAVSPGRSFSAKTGFSKGGWSMCGPHFCSVKITEDVRKFAAEQQMSQGQAIQVGLKQKAKEFQEAGAETYSQP